MNPESASSQAAAPTSPWCGPAHKCPAALLARLQADWPDSPDLWIFGYASLIWRPEFEVQEARPARVQGWHRALRMRSRINRGTPEQPGLVFALLAGGACRGMVYRVPRADALPLLEQLWAREMPLPVYEPRWLRARTSTNSTNSTNSTGGMGGNVETVPALAFTLSRNSPSWTGALSDAQMVHILRHASGRYGRTLDYLAQTASALQAVGIHDSEIQRLMRLARQHGLLGASVG